MFLSTKERILMYLKKYGPNVAIFLLFIIGILVLYRTMHQINIHDIYIQLSALPVSHIQLAILFTVLGYASLIGYDWSALRYVDKKLPLPVVAFTSFIGFSMSNTIGLSWLSGGAIRYRLYSRVGLNAKEITQVITFCMIGFGLGEILVGGLAIIARPDIISAYSPFSPGVTRGIAILLLAGALAAIFFRSQFQGKVHLEYRRLRIPSVNILSGQIIFSILDIGFAGTALYILLPGNSFPYLSFLAIFAIALVAGVISHVPGGVGVFEAVMATALYRYVPLESLTAALICFRIVYYLLPFIAGILLLTGNEMVNSLRRNLQVDFEKLEGGVTLTSRVARSAIPPALAGLTFIAGILLLFRSSIPLSVAPLHLLEDVFPVELFELSHIFGGVTGVMLIVLSFSLRQRVRAALWISGFLFIVGAVLSYLQTLDYGRTIFMLLALVLLYAGHEQFYRRAKLFSSRADVKGILLTLAALSSYLWLLLFSFKNTPYQTELWWKLAFDAQAPRGMRTAVFSISAFLILYTLSALRPPKQQPRVSDKGVLTLARRIIQLQDNANGNLALTDDKCFLFSENKNSFIMFSKHMRSWVAMGDPIGSSDDDMVDLIWEFKAAAHKDQSNAVFYQISKEHMDWYIDAGFNLFKLGEEARINLQAFTLEGARNSKLRQVLNKASRSELSFQISYPPHAPQLLKELANISDQWLALKKVREKSFSLGRFSPDYMNEFPLALVFEKGVVSAFANIFITQTKVEATIDLMRHRPVAERITMDYLFIALILALKDENYAELSLGMAPLSGLAEHEGARLWDRFGQLIYKKGKPFYNFEGLRSFKNKFNPTWVSRYLATTHKGTKPFLAMVDIAALTSDGAKGVFRK
jgi:phosphatidylglycerol lysyltransferase